MIRPFNARILARFRAPLNQYRSVIFKRQFFWRKSEPLHIPKGDIVYVGATGRIWTWMPIIGSIHAMAWTVQAVWQYFDPLPELGLRTLVMCAGVAWFTIIFFGFHARRVIVRMWLEDKRFIHIQTHDWWGKSRWLNVPVGCMKINQRRLKAMQQSKWGYYVAEILGKGRFFTIYRNGKFYNKEHVISIFGHPLVDDLQYSIAETKQYDDGGKKKKESEKDDPKKEKKKNLWKNKVKKKF